MTEEKEPVSAMTLWRRNNPDRARDYRLSYEEENRDELNRKRRDRRKRKPHLQRNQWLRQTYGVTLEWYEEKLTEQQHCCEICGLKDSEQTRRLAVDHNHETKQVRGLLCTRCNTILEKIENTADFMEKAYQYLKKYKT